MPTNLDKTTLQALWINGFIPQGTDYANLINSQVNVAETSAQTMFGSLSTPELITSRISANSATFGGATLNVSLTNQYAVSAPTVNIASNNTTVSAASGVTVNAGNNLNLSGSAVAASAANNLTLIAGGGVSIAANSVSVAVTAALNLNLGAGFTIGMAANNINISQGTLTQPTAIVSAAGTAQATAAICSATVVRCKGVVDGSTTGFKLVANKTGWTQYFYSDAVSANLWPPTGGQINALGANTVFPLTVNTLYTIVHIGASAYAVK